MNSPDIEQARPKGTWVRWQVAGWMAAAAASAYLCRNCLAVVESTVREDLNISENVMGFIMGPVFFWSYALAQIPGGWLGARFGSRRCLPVFSIAWSLGTAAWGLAQGYLLLLVGRLMVGLSQAGLFPCATQSISRWHPATERAIATASLGAAMQIGAAAAAVMTALLTRFLPWQAIFALFSIPGLLWAVGFYRWYRDRPEDHDEVNATERELILAKRSAAASASPSEAADVPWKRLITSRPLQLICAQQFFRAAGYVWFGTWFATYLQETRDISNEASGWLLAIPLSASFVAALMGGGLSDWVYRRTGSLSLARRGVATTSLVLCALLVFLAYFIADATLATVVIGAGVFCAAFAGPCAYSITIDMGGHHVAAVFSTMNMVGNFGAGLLPWVVPAFRRAIDQSGTMLAIFGDNSWNAVLLLFASMYVLAAACWMCLRVEGTVLDPIPSDTQGNATNEDD